MRTIRAIAWGAVLVLAVFLTVQRFSAAMAGDIPIDLQTFVRAAQRARAGGSVYLEGAYVYLPPIAWLLSGFESVAQARAPWTMASLAACWVSVAAVVAVLWPALRAWQRPVAAGVAFVTLLYSNVLATQLWLGQADTFLFALAALAVLAAAVRAAGASGALLAVAGALKTWPALLGLWLLRRGAPHRLRALCTAVGTGMGILLIIVLVSGPATVGEWIQRTIDFSDQDLISYSVWGVGRHLFSDSGLMPPLVDSPVLGAAASWLLAAAIVAGIVLTLWRPGTDSLAMWNIAAATVLLLPVSHLSYRLLMLPLVWVWCAYLLRRPRVVAVIVVAAVAVVFWIAAFRLQPLDSVHTTGTGQYVAVMAISLALLAASVAAATVLHATDALPPRTQAAARRRDLSTSATP